MIERVSPLAVVFVSLTASATFAQQHERLPLAVLDARVASAGLPTGQGWTPPVPQGTQVPGRSLAVDVGGHVYLFRARIVSLGVGVAALVARGSATTDAQSTTESVFPEVTTRVRSLTPQISLNFGHRQGWSYLSGGLGRARVASEVSRALTATSPSTVEIGWVRTLNYGGGARWFLGDHIALNLDLRWHTLPLVAATATQAGAGRATLIVAGGGISIR